MESILGLLKTLKVQALLFVINLTLTLFIFHPLFEEISKAVAAVTYSFSRFGGQLCHTEGNRKRFTQRGERLR
jgi:hypothetical protein